MRTPARNRDAEGMSAVSKLSGGWVATWSAAGLRPEGAPIMDTDVRDFPQGDLRISDADRDRALAELSEAFQAGRITADEFHQRTAQVLSARTGKELTALLADLPRHHPFTARATGLEPARRVLAARITMGASAIAATALAGAALTNLFSHGPSLAHRELARAVLARMGLSVPQGFPPSPGFDWGGTVTPAAIAVLLVVLIIYLRSIRADRL
jgi:Domain of unknown function (DUF1707)